ncbi:MAG: stringent starvation protein A, partial [uncultured bacterium]
MAVVTNKRSVMTLYSGAMDIYSHRVRIALAEKGVLYEAINVESRSKPERLFEINPYGTVPTLVDRDLALYEPNIIMEYLDERFPHPPLMPVYPVLRAKARLII